MWFGKDWIAWCLFGSEEQANLLLPACITLVTNIAYNYFLEASIALRRIKVGSIMELISSWTFAISSICLLYMTNLGSYGVVLSFAAGNLLGACFAMTVLVKVWDQLPNSRETFTHISLWQKLAPFAIGLWLVNIITNLFDMVDRYMIVHFAGIPPSEAQGLVGQYFSSMAVPLLMVGVSTTLAHLVMPYLSKDWEAGRLQAVSNRVNLSLKMIGLMLSIASVVILCVAPLLFGVIFAGKYSEGFAILPITIAFCFWNGIAGAAYNYLYCVERTKLMCVSLLSGLVTNIALNALLLPRLGLLGAALATATGCAVNLTVVLFCSVRHGLRLHRGVYWVLAFPLVLSLGPTPSAITLIGLLWLTNSTTWVFTGPEREQLEEIVTPIFARILPKRFSLHNAT
jgi:O-antigen/teichoic acid export membrane protein